MPLEAQTRLLRVLQEGEYTRVGGETPSRANVRIISATHQNLQELIQDGLFRQDLFYRLNVVPLRLPPLRERIEDIPLLLRYFFKKAAQEGNSPKTLDISATEKLESYDWPGNVRELENLVRRITALYTEEVISADIVETELSNGLEKPQNVVSHSKEGLTGSLNKHLKNYFLAHKGSLPATGLYERIIQEVERPLINQTLIATRGNQIKAAELLGINRNTLRKKIKLLDIQIPRGSR